MKTLDVICPVFNEAEVIEAFYAELKKQLALLPYTSRMIFVLDASTDRTAEIIQAICKKDPQVTLIMLSARFGHQLSLVAGMDHSSADYVVMMDCDLEHPPSVIPRLLEKAAEGYDIVYTTRHYAADTPALKKLTSSLYYRFINVMTDLTLTDGSADFRLISGKVRDVFKHSIREQNQFLRGLFSWVGFRSAHVDFVSQVRAGGVSKYRLNRLIRFAAVGIVSFSKKPLRLAIYTGFLVSVLALLSIVYHLYSWMIHSNVPQGWATLAILISFIGGAQLFCLGILGEYLGFIFDEVKGRPLYIVDRKVN